jgi:hypothetical protein
MGEMGKTSLAAKLRSVDWRNIKTFLQRKRQVLSQKNLTFALKSS